MLAANQDERILLRRIFAAAVDRVEPARLVREHLAQSPGGLRLTSGRSRIWLVAAGKASAAMARETARILGEKLTAGVVAAPGRARDLPPSLLAFSAGHPLPNGGSLAAGRAVWRLLGRVKPRDIVLVLLSGGASSLLVLPAPGITLADKVRTTELLLRSGGTIAEVNTVRKHLSRLKGGGIVRRAGAARVSCLLLSDVIGNSPAVIGSGPAASDPTTYRDAWHVLERRGILGDVPASVRRLLEGGRGGRLPETLKPGGRAALHRIIGDNRLALAAAAEYARVAGLEPDVVTASLRGDTRASARWFAGKLGLGAPRRRRDRCVLAGGETTVEVRGGGRGGRNQEFALALAEEIAGVAGIFCLSAGSDGVDGPTDAAGAFVDGATVARARRLGISPAAYLSRNDSYGFFRRIGGLFRPGPTGTNVMDLKIAVVRGRGRS